MAEHPINVTGLSVRTVLATPSRTFDCATGLRNTETAHLRAWLIQRAVMELFAAIANRRTDHG